jgi:hypothetical protein
MPGEHDLALHDADKARADFAASTANFNSLIETDGSSAEVTGFRPDRDRDHLL